MITIQNSGSQLKPSGGRKTALAHVQLVSGSGTTILVNGKPASEYFQNNAVYLQILTNVTDFVKTKNKYDAHVIVQGGGLSAQAQAIRLALSKAFVAVLPECRSLFKKPGSLTRDARIKERRKYGLKKARKAPQFSKR